MTKNPTITDLVNSMTVVDQIRSQEELINDILNEDVAKKRLADKLKGIYLEKGVEINYDYLTRAVDKIYETHYTPKINVSGLNYYLAKLVIFRNNIINGIKSTLFYAFVLAAILGVVFTGISYTKQAIKDHNIKIAAELKAKEQKEIEDKIRAEKVRQSEIAALPAKLEALYEGISKIAKEPKVITKAEILKNTGISRLKSDDLKGALTSLSSLKELIDNLNSEYEVRVNLKGRKGGSDWVTGGWRNFKGNRRYYVVVNAVDSNGEPVKVPVRNEEDGSIKLVSSWAEQVSEGLFESIKNEKTKTGTLEKTLFAQKNRGYLYPEYKIGAKSSGPESENLRITSW